MANRTKLKAGCGLFSVFAVGFLCGALVLFIALIKVIPLSEGWRDEDSKEFVLNHLASRLDLSDGQIDEIKPIVFSALEERYELRKVYVTTDIEITGRALREMEPILNGKQKEEAARMFANWKKGKERFLIGKESKEP